MAVMRHLTVDGTTYDTVGEASVTQVQTSGTKIAMVSIDGTSTDIYAPSGGGSTVSVTQSLTSGTQVGSISVDGNATALYAPTPPTASTTAPSMDGTAAVGSSAKYAREDHVHPTDTSRAASSHDHGSITNAGAITSDTAAASGDKLVIADSSDSSKLKRSGIAFGSSTSTFLRNDGTWATPSGGGGGGGSWTDVSSLFTVIGAGGEEVRAITDGTLVYLSAWGGSIDYVQIPSEYTPVCMSFGTAISDDQSTVIACYVDDGGAAQAAAGGTQMFGLTVVYPIAIA